MTDNVDLNTRIPLSIIAAITENRAIGKNNSLLFHISEDLKRFKKITSGHTILMGRKTYESLPYKPLPNRKNVVLTRDVTFKSENTVIVNSPEEALLQCHENSENFVIGGGGIYRLFLPLVQKIYFTIIHDSVEADTFFPPLEEKVWKTTKREERPFDPGLGFSYEYVTLERNFLESNRI